MLQLWADQYCLKIDTDNINWCKCWLIINGNETYIGAADLKYLKNHFLAGLDNSPKETSGRLHGHDVNWLLSLSEIHTVLYIATEAANKILFFQDAGAPVREICMMKLSQNQCSQWLNQIQQI